MPEGVTRNWLDRVTFWSPKAGEWRGAIPESKRTSEHFTNTVVDIRIAELQQSSTDAKRIMTASAAGFAIVLANLQSFQLIAGHPWLITVLLLAYLFNILVAYQTDRQINSYVPIYESARRFGVNEEFADWSLTLQAYVNERILRTAGALFISAFLSVGAIPLSYYSAQIAAADEANSSEAIGSRD